MRKKKNSTPSEFDVPEGLPPLPKPEDFLFAFPLNMRIFNDGGYNVRSEPLTLYDDKRVITPIVGPLSLFEKGRFEQGEQVIAYCRNEDDVYELSVLISEKTYELLEPIGSVFRHEYLRSLCAMEEPKRKLIIDAIRHQKELPVSQSEFGCNTGSEFRMKFALMEPYLPSGLKKELESILKIESTDKTGKALRKLRYLLDINTVPLPGSKTVHPDDFVHQLSNTIEGNDDLISKLSQSKGGAFLLVGAEGTGKKTLAKAVSKIRAIPYVYISLKGITTSLSIIGDSPIFQDSDAGIIAKELYKCGTTHCVVYLDGIDALCNTSNNGSPAEALAPILKGTLHDLFVQFPIDVSDTLFIAGANSTESIPYCLKNAFGVNVYNMQVLDTKIKTLLLLNHFDGRILDDPALKIGDIDFKPMAGYRLCEKCRFDDGMNTLFSFTDIIFEKTRKQHLKSKKRIVITEESIESFIKNNTNINDERHLMMLNIAHYSKEDIAFVQRQFQKLKQTPKDEELICWKECFISLNRLMLGDNTLCRSIDEMIAAMKEEHYGLDCIITRMAEIIYSTQFLSGKTNSRILLHGPQGVGKTSLINSLAKNSGCELIRIPLNGQFDPFYIKGSTCKPGILVQKLAACGKKCMILLDEIDKAGQAVMDSLLDILDNHCTFIDNFYRISMDLSKLIIIATANDISKMNPWLLDRFECVALSGYADDAKQQILERCLIPKYENKWNNCKIVISFEACTELLKRADPFGNVRSLENMLKQLIEHKMFDERSANLHIDKEDVCLLFEEVPSGGGNIPYDRNIYGYVNGLEVLNECIGNVFAIETLILPQFEEIKTGLVDEKISESVQIAKSYIRTHYPQFGDFGYHIHFGENAIRKSGTSAGVPALLSMLSALMKQRVDPFSAFTGEISLKGDIYSVGCIQAKIEAAVRAGCRRVFIPFKNYCELKDEQIARYPIEIIGVCTMEELIPRVLIDKKNEPAVSSATH